MPSLIEYFNNDFNKLVSIHTEWAIKTHPTWRGIIPRAHFNFTDNSKFLSFYVPNCEYPEKLCEVLVSKYSKALEIFEATEVQSSSRHSSDPSASSRNLIFTNKIFIYTEKNLDPDQLSHITKRAKGLGLVLFFRGPDYVQKRNENDAPLAFISHDSRDKESFVRPLADVLNTMCPVWYDEFSLNVGDNLREKIEKGLRSCKKCVLVLSPHFLSNRGWTKTEFESVFTRELIEEKNIILPIWHDVTREDIYAYSPSLVNRLALDSSLGPEKIAQKLFNELSR